MEKKISFRVKVMKYAHNLFNATQESWSLCVKRAWQLYKLAKIMREREVKFSYWKADGTIRQAHGTLRNLPAGVTNANGKKRTKPSYKTFSYYDTDKNQFRCFRVENLISVY